MGYILKLLNKEHVRKLKESRKEGTSLKTWHKAFEENPAVKDQVLQESTIKGIFDEIINQAKQRLINGKSLLMHFNIGDLYTENGTLMWESTIKKRERATKKERELAREIFQIRPIKTIRDFVEKHG